MRPRHLAMALGSLFLGLPLLAAPGVVTSLATATSAAAASSATPSISATRLDDGRVRLSGRTRAGRSDLNVQRYDDSRRRYIHVRRITSSAYGWYKTTLPARTTTTAYRVRDLRQARSSVARWVSPARDSCGIRPVKWNGTLYDCTWAEEFSGTELDTTKWYVHGDTSPNTGNPAGAAACYKPDNVSVKDGSLHLVARYATLLECPTLTGALKILTAGQVSTFHKWSQRYGRFEARVRNTATTKKGLHEAFWLWPDAREVDVTKWPYSGEIDVSETYSNYHYLTIPFLHSRYDAYGNITSGPNQNTAHDCLANRGVWNTHRLEWGASKIRIYVNDKLCLEHSSGDPAFKEKYIVAFTQLLGSSGNNFNLLDPPPIPATY
ncbi:MAG TPA: glycoside hydrolase family 16 protein, partial [Nocardioides sp.]